ncbi:MAG: Uncharacterised protein [Cryomorphaceae bacterium]|nr:MAG: Uncharacterised protein [Cryomorphaceae bacterium]
MYKGAFAFSPKMSIKNASAGSVDAPHACKLWNPATVTPIKFTKSFPANAMAKENVPASTMNFSGLNAKNRDSKKVISDHTTTLTPIMLKVFALIQSRTSEEMNEAPLRPLISKK